MFFGHTGGAVVGGAIVVMRLNFFVEGDSGICFGLGEVIGSVRRIISFSTIAGKEIRLCVQPDISCRICKRIFIFMSWSPVTAIREFC